MPQQAHANSIKHSFEDEVFFSLQRQRNRWATTAIASLILAGLCVIAFISLFPLKEIKPYVVMVDKTTGEAEKVVSVRAVNLTEQEAVLQAELVSYITDRETYDISDNAERIPEVLKRSSEQAADGIRSVWSSTSPQYPPDLYGKKTRILVTIKSITLLPDTDIARVRFVKSREDGRTVVAERSFVTTVTYKFDPKQERNLETVWSNPLGFYVENYRIDAETLQK